MKRQSHRLALALPIELQNGNGVTRDISTSGVFFETDLSFSAGAEIIFSMILEHADPVGPLRLHCHGEVVRVERLRGKFGVAVAIDQHRFYPSETSTGSGWSWAQQSQQERPLDQTDARSDSGAGENVVWPLD